MPLSSVVGAQSIIKPGVCTSSTRPASPYTGQMIYESDTNKLRLWNGSAWSDVTHAVSFAQKKYKEVTMSNNKQQTKEEKLNRIKMIIELKANKTFLSILADFRLYKVHCMTIYDNQIEDECELASYWLNVELNEQ
jgi:hypothetical protein